MFNLRKVFTKLANYVTIDRAKLEEIVKEIQRELIRSNVDVKLVLEISGKLRKIPDEKIQGSLREHVLKRTYEILLEYLGEEKEFEIQDNQKILLIGLFGSGKTTTAAKLAYFLKKKGKKVILLPGDTFRPAAFEQLKQLAEKIDVPFVEERSLEGLLRKVPDKGIKILDSAGRSSLDEELAEELKWIYEKYKPDFTFLVISADIGKVARQQIENFMKILPINGIILTKVDSSFSAGGAITATYLTKVPIFFIGTGEKIGDFERFNKQKYLNRLLGFGDLEGLLEKMKEAGVEKIDLLEFTLKTFKEQIEASFRMGPFQKILDLMGLGNFVNSDKTKEAESKMKKFKYILDSMTNYELEHPDVIDKSRIRRIAAGSGTKEEEVRELLANYRKIKKLYERFKGGKLESLLKKMGMKGMKGMKFKGAPF